ncbi:MAG: energy transducer TonB [Candidatus Aminicenantes bacterium]|nr:energy transducer TonB [Candidatus Aminicenantes bacterium]
MKNPRHLLIALTVCCGLVLASSQGWAEPAAVQAATVPDRGHALLNKLDSFFESLMGGVLAPDSAAKTLAGLKVESEQARARGAVTEDFFRRYARIVRTVRLVVATDPNAAQAASAEKEIGLFIKDILGQGLEADASVSQQINKLSEAVAKEIAALRRGLIERGIPYSDATDEPVREKDLPVAPKQIKDVRPVYPAVAQNARVQGVVILEALIDIQGNVKPGKIIYSIPLLDQAAIDAVAQWKYEPTFVDGKPVEVILTVTVTFTL